MWSGSRYVPQIFSLWRRLAGSEVSRPRTRFGGGEVHKHVLLLQGPSATCMHVLKRGVVQEVKTKPPCQPQQCNECSTFIYTIDLFPVSTRTVRASSNTTKTEYTRVTNAALFAKNHSCCALYELMPIDGYSYVKRKPRPDLLRPEWQVSRS